MCIQSKQVYVLNLKMKTDVAETENYKVICFCRQNNIVVKGNKNMVGISSPFFTVKVSVKKELWSYR